LKLHGGELSASYSDQFNIGESSPGNEQTGGQLGFRARLDLVANRKILVLGCGAHMHCLYSCTVKCRMFF